MPPAARLRAWAASLAALLGASEAPATTAPREAPAATAPREPLELFRFSAGSTLFAAPGLGRDGSLYVGSGDGYLHALKSDGAYRWSYTVKGRITASPLEDPRTRRIFVVTSEARLYCLEPDGRLRWVFSLPVAPKSELGLSDKGTVYLLGRDDHLYGLTTGGAMVLRLAAPSPRSAPVVLAGGQLGLVLGETIATLKGYGYERTPLPATFAAGSKLAMASDRAISACEDGRARVHSGAGMELSLRSDCLSAPVKGDGFFAVAEANGAVRLVSRAGGALEVPLGAAPLRPLWDGARRRLVLSTATGVVRVLELLPNEGER